MMRTLLGFIKKELIQSLRDPRLRVSLVVMPIIQLCLFGFAISTEIKNIKLGAQFSSDDFVMRDIYERCIASGWFIPAGGDASDPYQRIESGKADAVLVPPAGGFTKALGRGDAKIQVLINSINVTKAQSVDGYLRGIIQKSVAANLNLPTIHAPIQIDQRVLFNPDLDTSTFMIPAIMAMLMLISTMITTNVAIVREKALGTFEMLISAPVSKSEIIFGKTIPYVILGMSSFPLVLTLAVVVFKVPMRGNLLVLFIAALAFTCTAVAMGALLSTLASNAQQATLASFFVMFPMVMFSGLMFPIENMPDYIRWLSYIDPLAHFMGLLRNIMLKGGGAEYVFTHVSILILMAVLTVALSIRRFHTTLR